jgi:glycosyltransferase involved in cell wall biosynthesis
MSPQPLLAPENDYREAAKREPGPVPSVTVIVPVYNRPQLLENVLAGLVAQSIGGFDIVVVDDGSEDAIEPVVRSFEDRLDVRYLRQHRDGFGTHRARNLGVASTDAEVVAFVDADCVPGPEWLERHLDWHRRASNLLVTGSRRHVDTMLDPEAVATGDLLTLDADPRAAEPDDWRRLVYRRSQRLIHGDEGYRAAIGGNSSIRRDRYLAAGGGSDLFTGWGGEDTELAWRIWNDGAFVVPEDRAMIYHQRVLDAPNAIDTRTESREQALPLLADLIPHRFYRKTMSPFSSVPKISWVAMVESEDEARRVLRMTSDTPPGDAELILYGPGAATWESAARASDRFGVANSFAEAVAASRGEIVITLDGRIRFDPRHAARALKRLENPRTSMVRVGYRIGGRRVLGLGDLAAADLSHGRGGLPLFAAVRRRELMKDRDALANPGEAWRSAEERSRLALLVTDLIEAPADYIEVTSRAVPAIGDLRAAGSREVARGVMRAVRPKAEPEPASPDSEQLAEIAYVGLPGQRNLGDEAMLLAIRTLMPWANVDIKSRPVHAVMLGGGTLFNADSYYRDKVDRLDGPGNDRLVFGTGMRSPAFFGVTEEYEEWEPFLRSSLLVGVRGPHTLEGLREWGYEGEAEIIGDPALSLQEPEAVDRVAGRVVVSPVFTSGESWGQDDGAVFDQFARTIDRLTADGREVVLMTAHPNDDRWALEIMRKAGHPDLPYLAGYDDIDAALRLLASADLVIGERLHAVVLAAAVGTPFVAVEYRPKVRDFAASVGRDDTVVRTDEIERLDDVVRMSLERSDEQVGETAEAVAEFRKRQSDAAASIRATLEG